MSEALDLQRSIETLNRTIDSLRAELVRKDVYIVAEKARDAEVRNIVEDVADIRSDVRNVEEKRAADRRLLLTAFALPLLLILIQLYLASQVGG